PMRMFIYAGEKESRFMSQHIHQVKDALAHGFFSSKLTTFNIVIDPDGQHQEKDWGDIFPAAVKGLCSSARNGWVRSYTSFDTLASAFLPTSRASRSKYNV